MPLPSSDIWWLIVLGTTVTVSFAVFFISAIALNQRRFIRAQKEKFEEVRKSEVKYSDLFNNVTDVVFIHSLSGELLEINSSGLSLLNVTAGDIVGKSLNVLFDDFTHRRIQAYLLEVRLRGRANGMFSIRTNDGRELTFEYRNSLVKKNDTSVAVRGIARDITEQRLIERSLRASQIRFQRLVKYSPLPMIIHAGKIIRYVNEAALTLMKARHEGDILGRKIEEFIILGYFPEESGESPRSGSASSKPEGNGRSKHPVIVMEKLRQLSGELVDVETASLPVFFEGIPAVHTVIRDITRSKQLEATLREMPKRIIDAQEAERGRVSRELHDGVSQILGSVKFRLQVAAMSGPPETKGEDLGQMNLDLEQAIDEIRRISYNLRPEALDNFGLHAAVRSMCEKFKNRTSTATVFTCDELTERMPPDIELALFRIIQEALNNIEKHAKATEVTIGITADEETLQATIVDNGRGFDFASASNPKAKGDREDMHGLGLHTMKERAAFVGGSTMIRSAPYEGTRIDVRIPRFHSTMKKES